MSFSLTSVKEHLIGMGHSSTLNKVRNQPALFERAANNTLARIKVLEGIRTVPLTSTVYDDIYNYALPADYGSLLDLIPQDNRELWDKAFRGPAGEFDRTKAVKQKTISIEADGATKIIRINWRTRQGKILHSMNSLAGNGTWSVVGSATGLVLDKIYKYSGSGSIRFNLVTTGDGIQNTTMSAVDMTDEDEVADIFVWFYIKNSTDLANLTSVTPRWGNDLTTNYWTGVAQTVQADGTAFKVGWNLIKTPWSTATETGTVAPATIDSFRIVFAATAAISQIRVDNIIFTIGRAFDLKYYSKFLFRNAAGTFLSRPAVDEDTVICDNDSLNIFLNECLKAMAHQVEGTDSAFDITFAENEQKELIPAYRAEHPSQAKKLRFKYGSGPRWTFRQR